MDIRFNNPIFDQSTINCKITPSKFGNSSYCSDEYHFKRITLEEHYPDIIFDESKIIDEYKND